jgi:hypothetical protein
MSKNTYFESITRWLNNNFIPVVGSTSSLVMLLLYILLEKHKFVINYYSLILFFSIFLFPATNYLEKIKIGSLELTRKQEIIEKRSITGEVVTADGSNFYYIDKNLKRYELPDIDTAEFFCSNKGFIRVGDEEIRDSFLLGKIESVNSGEVVNAKGHIFIVLNKKFKHVGTASWLLKWKKEERDATEEEISMADFW